MSKKLFSMRLDEELIQNLDEILDARGISRTAFIEDFLITYTNFMKFSTGKITVKPCPECGKHFGGIMNCPNCFKK